MHYFEFDPSLTDAVSQAALSSAVSRVAEIPFTLDQVKRNTLAIADYANSLGAIDYERVHGLLAPSDEVDILLDPDTLRFRGLDLMRPLARHAGDARWQLYERALMGPLGRLIRTTSLERFNPLFTDKSVVYALENAIEVAKKYSASRDSVFGDAHTFAQTARLALYDHTISMIDAETDLLTRRLAESPGELRRALGHTGMKLEVIPTLAVGNLQPAA